VRATERVRMASGTPGSPGGRGQVQVNTVMVIVFIKMVQLVRGTRVLALCSRHWSTGVAPLTRT
jgi:hypothetical protein